MREYLLERPPAPYKSSGSLIIDVRARTCNYGDILIRPSVPVQAAERAPSYLLHFEERKWGWKEKLNKPQKWTRLKKIKAQRYAVPLWWVDK
jgi:hypothetical protein